MNLLTSAVAAVITDPAGRVLLCQQAQGRRWWGLPGGKVHPEESPLHAAVRDICEEVGASVTLVDLVGLYQLTSDNDDLHDVHVHVFRARLDGEVTVNSPRICHLSWHDADDLPAPMTPVSRQALADAVAGRSGILRIVHRDAEPEIPDADADGAPESLPAQTSAEAMAGALLAS